MRRKGARTGGLAWADASPATLWPSELKDKKIIKKFKKDHTI